MKDMLLGMVMVGGLITNDKHKGLSSIIRVTTYCFSWNINNHFHRRQVLILLLFPFTLLYDLRMTSVVEGCVSCEIVFPNFCQWIPLDALVDELSYFCSQLEIIFYHVSRVVVKTIVFVWLIPFCVILYQLRGLASLYCSATTNIFESFALSGA